MFNKLDLIVDRFVAIEKELAQEGLSSKDIARLSKERAEIEELVNTYRIYTKLLQDQHDAKELLSSSDIEIKEMAKEELVILQNQIEQVEQKLKILMLPQDPNDQKNILLEIRAGTGGDEATLFAGDLLRMYLKYAANQGWSTEILSFTPGLGSGYKEVILSIQGKKVYSRLKFEAGVHRVQRVPVTETQGRVHTSTCTVAVLPEADEIDVQINPADLEITTCRASGAGGQHVNKTDSAIRIVHIPTGIVVECQDERSQHKNKARALKILRARLFEKAQIEQQTKISQNRRSQVGSAERSEKVRTYNFPQNRLTDHRIDLTLYKLDRILEGELDEIIDALITDHQVKLLSHTIDQKSSTYQN